MKNEKWGVYENINKSRFVVGMIGEHLNLPPTMGANAPLVRAFETRKEALEFARIPDGIDFSLTNRGANLV